MARSFTPTEYLYTNSSPISDVPCTFSFHGWADASAGAVAVMSACKSGSVTRYLVVLFQNNKLRIGQHETYIDSSNTWPDETWVHGAVTFVSDTERHIYLNNTKTDNTDTTTAFSGLDRFGVGVLYDSTPSSPYWGRIANVAVWNAVLSDDEIAALYNNGIGLDPRCVRPDALAAYWPLLDDDNDVDWWGQYDLTPSGSPTYAAGPPLLMPSGVVSVVVPATGGTTYSITCAQGSYAVTGQAVGVTADRTLALGQGSYTVSGQAVGITRGYRLACAQGSYTLTGQDVTLAYGTTPGDYSLVCAQGSYALTGQDVGITADRTVALAYGAYTLTGQDASFSYGRTLALEQGSYTLTGQDLTLSAARTLALGQGTYTYTGYATGLTWSGADLIAVPGVEYRVGQAKQHYKLDDKRLHYVSKGTD